MTATAAKKILIVDDQPENIHILIEALDSEYDVYFATNGEKALNIARSENRPDLVLLDIMMPGISGYEVCRQMKNEALTWDIPVIFITAQTDEADEEDGFRLGGADYITKPFRIPIVKARVRAVLQLKDEMDKRLALAKSLEVLNNHLEERIQDKTRELRLAHENLKVSEKKFRTIFENAIEGIFQTAPDGKVHNVSPSFARLMGYDSVENLLTSRPNAIDYYYNPEDRANYLRLLTAEQKINGYETRFRKKNGDVIWVSLSAKIMPDEAGAREIYQGFAIDITKQKRAAELELANLRLRELDALKSALMSTASHDLRSPMTAILGFGEMITKRFTRHFLPLCKDDERLAAESETILDYLDTIDHEGHRLIRLVNDFLDLSKIESGCSEWYDRVVRLDELISKAVKVVGGQLQEGVEISLQTEFSPDLPEVFCDPDRMMQVMVNLLGNAVKFTSQGIIKIQAMAIGPDQVEVRVRDNGPGIPDDDKLRIFDKFHQVRQHCNSGASAMGTGLGLTICKQIVVHYGGKIWVESAGDSGSVFIFRLPAGRQQQEKN